MHPSHTSTHHTHAPVTHMHPSHTCTCHTHPPITHMHLSHTSTRHTCTCHTHPPITHMHPSHTSTPRKQSCTKPLKIWLSNLSNLKGCYSFRPWLNVVMPTENPSFKNNWLYSQHYAATLTMWLTLRSNTLPSIAVHSAVSFPDLQYGTHTTEGLGTRLYILMVTESWAGPGNRDNIRNRVYLQ